MAPAKSRLPHFVCLHFMAFTTSRGVVHHILLIIPRSPESLDAYYLSYNNMPSYSYAPNLPVRMHTINISQRERVTIDALSPEVEMARAILGCGGRSFSASVGPQCQSDSSSQPVTQSCSLIPNKTLTQSDIHPVRSLIRPFC